MAYLDLDTDIKPWLGIDNNAHDTTLTIIRDSVEQAVINYIEVSLEVIGPVLEVYDATESDCLTLRNYPIESLLGVYFGCKPDGSDGTQISSDDYGYDPDTGVIKFQNIYTPRGRLFVRVDYSYGYSTLPADIKHAMLLGIEADFRRKGSKTIGRSARSKKDESETFTSGAGQWDPKTGLPLEVIFKLNSYRRFEFANMPMATRNL